MRIPIVKVSVLIMALSLPCLGQNDAKWCPCSAYLFTGGEAPPTLEPPDIGRAVATPGGSKKARLQILNYGTDSCQYGWSIYKLFGTPIAEPSPASGEIELGPGGTLAKDIFFNVPADTPASKPDAIFYLDVESEKIGDFRYSCAYQNRLEVIPTGEFSQSAGWDDANSAAGGHYGPTVHLWKQTLTPTTADFAGRTIRPLESTGGVDTCWFEGSAVERYVQPRTIGGYWFVGAPPEVGNMWGPDPVGWSPYEVEYYRKDRANRGLPMPCGTSFVEVMQIDNINLSDAANYAVNRVYAGIDETTVSSGRCPEGQVCELITRTWPGGPGAKTFDVTMTAFIQPETVEGPGTLWAAIANASIEQTSYGLLGSAAGITCGVPPLLGVLVEPLWFSGNDRSFDPTATSYKLKDQWTLSSDESQYPTGLVGTPSQTTTFSKSYAPNSFADGRLTSEAKAATTASAPVCDLLFAEAMPNLSLSPLPTVTRTGTSITSHIEVQVGDPLVLNVNGISSVLPNLLDYISPIRVDLTLTIDLSANMYHLSGTHTCYPAFEIYLNRMPAYTFTPTSDSFANIASCLAFGRDPVTVDISNPLR